MTGTIARPNGWRGLVVSARALVRIETSIFSGNGLFAWDAGTISLSSSFVGIGSDRRPLGNGASGAFIRSGYLRIDGTVIAHNAHWGVSALPGAYMLAVHSNSFYSNGVLGIDWGVDLQTLHSTSTSPAAPVITSAIYDPVLNKTTVRGTITVDRVLFGDRNLMYVYSSGSSRTRHGFVEGERVEGSSDRFGNHNAPGTSEWTVVIPGDLRGRVVTALTAVGSSEGYDHVSSEFSLPVTVQ
ncbi:MAG TPA: hypothetical protein VE010_15425 [Thermoanaerobaculia bacterium]|nr:hypothetical protein [Thermoanaerobaculia bacterium]